MLQYAKECQDTQNGREEWSLPYRLQEEDGPDEKPTSDFSLQNYEKINFRCLSHSLCSILLQKPQETSKRRFQSVGPALEICYTTFSSVFIQTCPIYPSQAIHTFQEDSVSRPGQVCFALLKIVGLKQLMIKQVVLLLLALHHSSFSCCQGESCAGLLPQ